MTSPRVARWVAAATAAVAVAAFLSALPAPYSNIDEYHSHQFVAGFGPKLASVCVGDSSEGRFRPMYWALEGALGAVTGGTGTGLHVGRLGFLAAAVVVQIALSLRLGAGLLASAALALLVNWSLPAVDVWPRGGPAEAFAQPLALGCTLLVLRARGCAAIGAAAAVGLAAVLAKESYAGWTAAALASFAAWSFARGERGRTFWTAVAGSLVQVAPAALAVMAVRVWSSSYLKQVLTAISAPPGATASKALDINSLACVLAAPALVVVFIRLARLRVYAWPLEDVVVLAIVLATLSETLAMGFVVPRYQLPLATALVLLAARGSMALQRPRRGPAVAIPAAVLLAVGGGMGARAHLAARAEVLQSRTDERFRNQLRSVLVRHGAARISWAPEDVEQPMGAFAHLEAYGIRGRIQLEPCTQAPAGMTAALDALFAGYRGPVSPTAPLLTSTRCPGITASTIERACVLKLDPWPRLRCNGVPERAVLSPAPP